MEKEHFSVRPIFGHFFHSKALVEKNDVTIWKSYTVNINITVITGYMS